MTSPRTTPDARPGTFDRAGAQEFCGRLAETVDALIRVLDEETRLVRAAKLTDAAALGEEKSELSDRYARAHATLTQSHREIGALAPVEIDQLRRRHQALETAVSANLAVLATARTVSETLIRGLAESLAGRDGGPRTYGADATREASAAPAAPFSVNVAL